MLLFVVFKSGPSLSDTHLPISMCSRTKVLDMWKEIGADGEVERTKCWDFVLGDGELASLVASGNQPKGKAMLEVMKAVRALDASGDGLIDALEFQRLYLPSNLLAAENAVYAGYEPSFLLALYVGILDDNVS